MSSRGKPPSCGQRFLDATASGSLEQLERESPAVANVDIRDASGNSALMLAAASGRLAIVRWLRSRRADVNATNGEGQGPLLAAAATDAHDGLKIAKELLEAGASPDGSDGSDETPLMAAAARGDETLVHVLLSAGATPARTDASGRTASDSALCAGHLRLAEHLGDADRLTRVAPPAPGRSEGVQRQGAGETGGGAPQSPELAVNWGAVFVKLFFTGIMAFLLFVKPGWLSAYGAAKRSISGKKMQPGYLVLAGVLVVIMIIFSSREPRPDK